MTKISAGDSPLFNIVYATPLRFRTTLPGPCAHRSSCPWVGMRETVSPRKQMVRPSLARAGSSMFWPGGMVKWVTRTRLLFGSVVCCSFETDEFGVGVSSGFCARLEGEAAINNDRKSASRKFTKPPDSPISNAQLRFSGLSAHRADFLGLDFVDDANLAGLAEGIHGLAEIFLRQFVDVVVGVFLGDFDDAPAHFEVAVGVGGILQRDSHARIAAHVLVLDAALGRIDSNVLAVEIHPDGRNLRAAVFHQRGEIAEGLLFKQVGVFFWNDFAHLLLRKRAR